MMYSKINISKSLSWNIAIEIHFRTIYEKEGKYQKNKLYSYSNKYSMASPYTILYLRNYIPIGLYIVISNQKIYSFITPSSRLQILDSAKNWLSIVIKS